MAAHSPCSLRPRAYRHDRAFGANIVKKRKTIAYPLSISLSPPYLAPSLSTPITVLSLASDLSTLSPSPLSRLEPFRNRENLPYERQMNIHAPVPLSWSPLDISGNQLTRANGRSHKAVSDVSGKKKCGRVTERRGRAAGGSKSAAGAIHELFGHSINNERWERR